MLLRNLPSAATIAYGALAADARMLGPAGATRDAGTAHDPANGQFANGSGGGGAKSGAPKAGGKQETTPELARRLSDERTAQWGQIMQRAKAKDAAEGTEGSDEDIDEGIPESSGEGSDNQPQLATQPNSGIPAWTGRTLDVNKGGNLPRSIEAATMGKWPGRTLD